VKIIAWLTDGTWEACVDATAEIASQDDEVTLLRVTDPELTEGLHGAYAGLVGRGRHRHDPGDAIESASRAADEEVLAAAGARLGRPAKTATRHGRLEREVVAAIGDASLLVVARDGDRSRVGPHSLGRATRFVVDHAPCAVLLIWPDEPDRALPPEPNGPPKHHGPPKHPRHGDRPHPPGRR
jgi:nucleotide-binding universal stress UspA family protein